MKLDVHVKRRLRPSGDAPVARCVRGVVAPNAPELERQPPAALRARGSRPAPRRQAGEL